MQQNGALEELLPTFLEKPSDCILSIMIQQSPSPCHPIVQLIRPHIGRNVGLVPNNVCELNVLMLTLSYRFKCT